jgi:kynurenine formamidase
MNEIVPQVPMSPWGPTDELGAANELSEALTLKAIRNVRTGRTFDLSQPISTASPRIPVVQSCYSICMWSNPIVSRRWYEQNEGATNAIGFADERVELDLHTGTHIDALGHVSSGDEMFNRWPVEESVSNWGLVRLGIDNLPPLVTRGVLVDIPLFTGRELSPGEVIGPDGVQGALRMRETSLQPGDIVLIRTGWARYYGVQNDHYVEAWPGIGLSCAEWLSEQRVVAVGADTIGLEVYPGEDPQIPYPVHQHLLARAGIYIIEQAFLEDIAESGVSEFLCLCLAPKFKGGTASPIRLTAVI